VSGKVRALRAGIVAVLLIFQAGLVRAADPAEVESLIREGVKLRRAGENHRALPVLRKAYDLARTPRTSAQLGLVEMSLGYPMDAEKHLEESLAVRHDVWVEHNRKVLEQSLAAVRAAIGSVELIGGPDGAEVEVNGKAAGTLPEARRVRGAEGPVEIVVRSPGYLPCKVTQNLIGGKQLEIALSLQRERPAPSAPIRPAAVPSPPVEETVRSEEVPDGLSTPAGRKVAWGLSAGALAAGAFAALQTTVWTQRRNDFDDHLGPTRDNPAVRAKNCGASDPGRGGPGCDDLYRSLDHARTLMLVGYAATGVLAAGAIVLFLVSAQGDSAPAHAMACAPAASPPGASCQFTF
jgi:hypothetical protein